jgi:hypothetical protein
MTIRASIPQNFKHEPTLMPRAVRITRAAHGQAETLADRLVEK